MEQSQSLKLISPTLSECIHLYEGSSGYGQVRFIMAKEMASATVVNCSWRKRLTQVAEGHGRGEDKQKVCLPSAIEQLQRFATPNDCN